MNQKYLSVSLTLAIILVLVISGPASAITLSIANVNDIDEEDTISFEVRLDIEATEVMSFSNFTVSLTNTDNDNEYSCTFDLEGDVITPCDDFVITALVTPANGVLTDLYGYGFGLSGWGPNEFGYGYGFLDTLAPNGEFVFQVNWTSPLVNGDTLFEVDFYATSRSGNNLFIFKNEHAQSFTILDVPVPITPDLNDEYEITQNNTQYIFPAAVIDKLIIKDDFEGVRVDFATNYNVLGNNSIVNITNAFGIYANTSIVDLIVQFPAGITIWGKGWDGVLRFPQYQMPSVAPSDVASSGYTATLRSAIEIGLPDVELRFDKAVRLVIKGEGGMLVGYARNGVFNQITTRCLHDTQVYADTLAEGGDCYRTEGSDLVIWTKHFTEFITYSQTSNAGGGGSSGGGSSGGGALTVTCVEEWVCSEWTACSPQGIRTRICTDNKACGTTRNRPAIQESCTYQEPRVPSESGTTTIERPEETEPSDITGGAVIDIVDASDSSDLKKSGFATKLLYAIIIVLILGGVIGGYYINNDPDMLHRRSANIQRKADMAHMSGKVVEAQQLYEKAYKLQQKALNKKLK